MSDDAQNVRIVGANTGLVEVGLEFRNNNGNAVAVTGKLEVYLVDLTIADRKVAEVRTICIYYCSLILMSKSAMSRETHMI